MIVWSIGGTLDAGRNNYEFIDKCDQSELRYILESMTSSDGLTHDLQSVTCRMFLAQNYRSLSGYNRHKVTKF